MRSKRTVRAFWFMPVIAASWLQQATLRENALLHPTVANARNAVANNKNHLLALQPVCAEAGCELGQIR